MLGKNTRVGWLLCVAGAVLTGRAAADDRFAAPADADAQELVLFMKRLAEPGHGFETREAAEQYTRRASLAISAAADRLLAGESTDEQAVQAIEMKATSLRVLEGLHGPGESEAGASAARYVAGLLDDARPAVALTALRMHVTERLDHWRDLRPATKAEFLDEVGKRLTSHRATVGHARLLTYLADVLGDSSQREQVLALVASVRPHLAESADPGMKEKLVALEGVVRRLRLPGAPIEVEGELLSGEPVDWEAYRGKVVLIDYWATWCGLCHAELPNIRRLHEQYAEQGFEVLGVSLDDDKARVERFLAEQGIPWPTLFGHRKGARGWDHPMVGKYGIHELPRAILVNRDGAVVHMNARGEQLAAQLGRLMAQPAAAAGVDPDNRSTPIEQVTHTVSKPGR